MFAHFVNKRNVVCVIHSMLDKVT